MIFNIIFSIILLSASMTQLSAANTPRKVIIDTDAGSDDAVAVLLALRAKEIEVVAITCTYGNSNEEQVEINVLKMLTIANRHDIPVYAGAVKPMIRNFTADPYFGKDGLGDFHFNQNITVTIDRSKQAHNAMIDLSKKFPGDLNIITLGPLTNIALAAQSDADFTRRVKRFYAMGSQLYYKEGEKKTAEYNFALDPESDAIILNSPMKNKILITPSDTATKNGISKVWREEVLGKLNSTAIKFLNKAERISLSKEGTWLPFDAVAMATMIWPNLITSSIHANMSVITDGPLSGVTDIVVPPNREAQNAEIITDFDVEGFKSKILQELA